MDEATLTDTDEHKLKQQKRMFVRTHPLLAVCVSQCPFSSYHQQSTTRLRSNHNSPLNVQCELAGSHTLRRKSPEHLAIDAVAAVEAHVLTGDAVRRESRILSGQ